MTPAASDAGGFTMVEVLAAIMLLAVGLLATALVFDGSRGLTTTSERTTVMAHRAQAEIERIQSQPWDAVAMAAVPERSATPGDPSQALTTTSPPALQPDRRSSATPERLVVDAAAGTVDAAPRHWTDGRLRGRIWSWVSWSDDETCGALCPTRAGGAKENRKRITVAVVVDTPGTQARGPMVVSTFVTDREATPVGFVSNGTRNPLRDPTVTCTRPTGPSVPCTTAVREGSGRSWFLYDKGATNTWSRVTDDHEVHRTVAAAPGAACTPEAVGTCPLPDLMDDEPTPDTGDGIDPVLPDRSTDLTPAGASAASGGRVLRRDDAAGCGDVPSTDDATSALWVTPPLEDDLLLTGDGGLTIFSRTTSGSEVPVTLCAQLLDAPGGAVALRSGAARVLAASALSYAVPEWPGAMTPVSFTFAVPGADLRVEAGRRLGVRLWVSRVSRDSLVIAYDHPRLRSLLQLNVR